MKLFPNEPLTIILFVDEDNERVTI